jgi:hypothetical protein
MRMPDVKASRGLEYCQFRKICIYYGQQTLTVACYKSEVRFCSTLGGILHCGEGAVDLHDRK